MVKTRIFNPTQDKQAYGWACYGGINFAPGQQIVMDGDVYTRNIEFPGNVRQIRADMASGRVQIVLITEFALGSDDKPPVAAKPVQQAPPIPVKETASADPLSGDNTLIDGVKDVGEAFHEPKSQIFDAITGEMSSDLSDSQPVSLSEALWDREASDVFGVDASAVEGKFGVPPAANLRKEGSDASKPMLDRAKLLKMSRKTLVAMVVKAGGSSTMAKDATTAELVDFLVSREGKETTGMEEAFT